ncbi:sulfatase [Candidatus Woesearchaeota archaeon]|nr:sulfatase [Candidatus Woesearchaeota archaeon]
MNAILLVVDSLRADHLGISGYKRDTSPNIDRLARDGVFFSSAIPTSPRTSPSVGSLLTGLYPHSHGLRLEGKNKARFESINVVDRLNKNAVTIQEILKSHGYATIGNDIEMDNTGIEKGFDEFNLLKWRVANKIKRTIKKAVKWNYNIDPAETLTDFAINQIKKLKDRKFFLYLHYVGLHWPYTPPEPYDEMFDTDYRGNHTFNEVNGKINRGDLIFNNSLPKEEIKHAIAHYDGAIRFVDGQIGRLISHLDSLGLRENTLIVLTADHGECFGEHGLCFNHGEYLYEEAARVPLIFLYHKSPKKKIDTQVQSTDIMPTILDILDIELIENIEGASLMTLVKDNDKVREYTFAESGMSFFKEDKRRYMGGIKGKWRMIRTDEWKLIYIPHPQKDIFELYNLKDDPMETINLFEKNAEIANKLREELFKWMKDSDSSEDMDLTEKSKKLLKKLGYID